MDGPAASCVLSYKAWDEWSDVRKGAWKRREKNPNVYYYRFKDPGEDIRKGPWTPPEHETFLNLMEKVKETDDIAWGLLSKNMPGRVGYQCRSYYKQLVFKGIIQPIGRKENTFRSKLTVKNTKLSNKQTTKQTTLKLTKNCTIDCTASILEGGAAGREREARFSSADRSLF